jgi:predicted aspartyl protease
MPGTIQGCRTGPTELPYVEVMVFNPTTERGDPVRALVDSGASHCCLSENIARALGLSIMTSHLTVNLASGTSRANSAMVKLGLRDESRSPPATVVIDLEVAVVAGMGSELILGWHALQYFDLTFARDGTFSLAWV